MHSLIRSANPHFSLLLAGNAVSAFGNSLFLIGLMLYFTTELVSPLFLGLAQAGAFLPVVLLGYTGGHLADTVSRPRMLAATDILRGLALAGTALLLPGAEAAGGIAAFLLLLCLVVLMGAMQALFQPALISLVSQMERESSGTTDLLALRTAVNHLFSLGGQGLGGLLAVLLGFPLLMLINGAGFFLSGLSELLIPERRHGGGGAGGAKGETKEEAGRGDGDKAEGLAASSRRTVAAELLRLNRQGAGLDLFLLVQFSYPFLAVTLPFFLRYRLELSSVSSDLLWQRSLPAASDSLSSAVGGVQLRERLRRVLRRPLPGLSTVRGFSLDSVALERPCCVRILAGWLFRGRWCWEREWGVSISIASDSWPG